LGYAKTNDAFTLGGTPARPDATALFARLAAGRLHDPAEPEN
jgi:hypothetical protein